MGVDATAVRFDDAAGELVILDQTALPAEVRHLRLRDPSAVREAIRELRVRGAPAIGIAAAFGAYLGACAPSATTVEEVEQAFDDARSMLLSSRPTAVNLRWALERMEGALRAERGALRAEKGRAAAAGASGDAARLRAALKSEADAIRAEDEEVCRRIGENGLSLLGRGWGILTHCNAGALATARYGTALAPLYLGHERGYAFRVFADETRPLLQGARLTAWELAEAGIDVTVICDNMASHVMSRGWIKAVLVGCDRVAANGDTANKIGTSGVAILARHYGIPLYVHAPLSTIDPRCPSGRDIPIEERSPEEITEKWYVRRMAPDGVKAYNPAFDVTDHELVSAIVTERGVVRPPYDRGIAAIMAASDGREGA